MPPRVVSLVVSTAWLRSLSLDDDDGANEGLLQITQAGLKRVERVTRIINGDQG